MIDIGTPTKLIQRCNSLRSNWTTRHGKFVDWYNILTLVDELKQEGMESVVSNDPRTGYNIAKHLMTSSIIAHKVYNPGFTNIQYPPVAYLEAYTEQRWNDQERRYRKFGHRGWKESVIGMMLAFGWVNVFAMVEKDKLYAEVWHPDEGYPEYGSSGLIEYCHIYTLTPSAAAEKVRTMGWSTKQQLNRKLNLYDYWGFDNDGNVANSIVLGTEFMKPPTVDPYLSKIQSLPIFCFPVGGLPDTGTIATDWQNHFGESIVATNEDLIKNYNRMLSFVQHAARSAAQNRWIELSSSETPIATEEKMNQFGAIFRGQPGEVLEALTPPTIPIELQQGLFTYQNMLQRGLFPAAIFGNIQQTMSYLAMANVASAALQVLTPYMDGLRNLLSDVDTFWYNMMKENHFHPNDFKVPQNMPDKIEFDVRADIEIPGYLVQRATVARMLDPEFRLSTDTVMQRLFPEIKDPMAEEAKARRDLALSNPKAILVDEVIAYRERADELDAVGSTDNANLYRKLADSLEAELGVPQQQQARTTNTQNNPVLNEVMPQEATEPTEGLGRIA